MENKVVHKMTQRVNRLLPGLFLLLTLMLFATRTFEQVESSPLGLPNINHLVGLAGAIFLVSCLLSSLLMSGRSYMLFWEVIELLAVVLSWFLLKEGSVMTGSKRLGCVTRAGGLKIE